MSSPDASPPDRVTPEQFYSSMRSPLRRFTSPSITNEQLLSVSLPESTASSSQSQQPHPSQQQPQQHPQPQQSQQQQQQPQEQPHQQQQPPKGPKQRQPRYQWDVARTRLAMQELLKYVTEHGFPKTSHVTSSTGSHPYDAIAATINGYAIPANNRRCDGRTVESKWDTLKKITYEKCSEITARFVKNLPDIAHEHGVELQEITEATSTLNVEGQQATIIVDPNSPHYKIIKQEWENKLAKETIQSIPMSEMSTWVSNMMDNGYKVKTKRKSPSVPASESRKKARHETRAALVDELGMAVSDSELSSSSRSQSASPSPRKTTKSPTAALNEKLAQYLEMQIAQSQQQQPQPQPQQPLQPSPSSQRKKKLIESYDSLASFYEIERVPPAAIEKLKLMGVMELDDLHYVTSEHYVRAGVTEIASLKLRAKVQRHAEPD